MQRKRQREWRLSTFAHELIAGRRVSRETTALSVPGTFSLSLSVVRSHILTNTLAHIQTHRHTCMSETGKLLALLFNLNANAWNGSS